MTTLLEPPNQTQLAGLTIGKVHINSQVLLAPMAGVTDVVFRGLVREYAPQSLICTEMISSNGMVFSKRNDARILDKGTSDHPIAYQLAGHHEDVLLEAAEVIVSHRQPDMIDVNMGCPVKKITGNFEGCALMKSPDVAYKLLSALVKSVDVPVTVKFRLGWDNANKNYLEFGQMAESAGVSMVTLHARTRAQGYAPGCDWDAFGVLKQALTIPVVANGDVTSLEDARHLIATYGVDGVMMGRAVQGRPWLIGDMDAALKSGQPLKERSLAEIIPICLDHARRHCEYVGEAHGIKEMRKHLPWYVKGFRGASEFRARLTQVSTLLEVEACLNDILKAGQ
ncbi:MAG: tRNA dihydrouridine synthase DusB [Vampirovibrionales bacterium]|nr:tRNA dihydrouridine synthase DusB [Vampirovibrionales bacterium]